MSFGGLFDGGGGAAAGVHYTYAAAAAGSGALPRAGMYASLPCECDRVLRVYGRE
jgi:hypothetical protein